ncbi:hypothetical protein [Amycolatopsis sp. NPDC001319]|uniref:hypothetical protein n=1 Tax=unclassified Amycolatopsis TaxID=2618356 RepID=UPI003684DDD9
MRREESHGDFDDYEEDFDYSVHDESDWVDASVEATYAGEVSFISIDPTDLDPEA